jgi:uncharacterized spore protein YtfJ
MANDNPQDPLEDDELDDELEDELDEFELASYLGDDLEYDEYDDEDYDYESVPALDVIEATFENFLDVASVDNVYSEPIMNGDTLVIPAAEVIAGLGFGTGFGTGSSGSERDDSQGSGGGGGGGGKVLARPVAVIIASPEGVRVEPVVDVTKIALAMFTAAGFMLAMVFRMMSPRRES